MASAGGTLLGRRRVPASLLVGRAGATVAAVAAGLGSFARRAEVGPTRAERAAREMRKRFVSLGPTYVKLGQLIASSPGLFPETLSNEFRTLLDQVPPADPTAIHALLVEELGTTPELVFARFDPVPIASASIAQVHTATLITGEEVVVKIQRPRIRARMAADVSIMTGLAAAMELSVYGRMANAKAIVADFAENLHQELDFQGEARAMEEWGVAVANSVVAPKVRVPKVYWEHTTKRVLIMERVNGTPIDNVAALTASGVDGEDLIKSILIAMVETALRGGIIHGDLHAGNILIDDQGRLVFLDFGIVGRFNAEVLNALREIVREVLVDKKTGALRILNPDFEALGRGIYRLGAVGKPGGVAEAGVEIRRFANPLISSELKDISYVQLLKQITDLGKVYDATLPRDFVLAAKQLLYVERYMKLHASNWQPIQDAELLTYLVGIVNEIMESQPVDSK